MNRVFTRHARKRMRQRAVSAGGVRRALFGKRRHQGKGVYRAEAQGPRGTTVVVYKQRRGKRVILSSWKRRRALRVSEV